MATHKNYCRRILKQYGRHIKNFENRLDNPLDMKMSKIKTPNSKGEKINLERRIEIPFYLKRGSRKISSYEDLVKLAE
ncbi:MAG: hypothetical protein ACOC56_05775 [Atribacterota bacterium]